MTTSDLDIREIYKSKFLSGDDLRGQAIACVVRKAGLQTLPADDGGMEDKIKLLLDPGSNAPPDVRQAFRKPIVLCKTEARKMDRWLNQPLAAKWVGAEVVVYPVTGNYFGKRQTVPRFRSARWPQRAQQQPRASQLEPPPEAYDPDTGEVGPAELREPGQD